VRGGITDAPETVILGSIRRRGRTGGFHHPELPDVLNE
jgi:hypothetical protein